MLRLFLCVFWPFVCLLWRNVCLDFLPIFWWGCLYIFSFLFFILSCRICLYILVINPLPVASFANIFSHSVGCLLVLFMLSFFMQKLLIMPLLFIFVFLFYFYFFISPIHHFFFYCTAWWPSYTCMHTLFFLTLSCSNISD